MVCKSQLYLHLRGIGSSEDMMKELSEMDGTTDNISPVHFRKTFTDEITTTDLYPQILSSLLNSFISGYNVAFMSIQTKESDRPRVIEDNFSALITNALKYCSANTTKLFMKAVSIRGETFRDLYNPQNDLIGLGDSPDFGYSQVEGIDQKQIHTVEEGNGLLKQAYEQFRSVGEYQYTSILAIYLFIEKKEAPGTKSDYEIQTGSITSRFSLIEVCPLETLYMNKNDLRLREGPQVVSTLESMNSILCLEEPKEPTILTKLFEQEFKGNCISAFYVGLNLRLDRDMKSKVMEMCSKLQYVKTFPVILHENNRRLVKALKNSNDTFSDERILSELRTRNVELQKTCQELSNHLDELRKEYTDQFNHQFFPSEEEKQKNLQSAQMSEQMKFESETMSKQMERLKDEIKTERSAKKKLKEKLIHLQAQVDSANNGMMPMMDISSPFGAGGRRYHPGSPGSFFGGSPTMSSPMASIHYPIQSTGEHYLHTKKIVDLERQLRETSIRYEDEVRDLKREIDLLRAQEEDLMEVLEKKLNTLDKRKEQMQLVLEELQTANKVGPTPVLKLFDTFKYVLDAYLISEEALKSKCGVLDREVQVLRSKLKDISRYGAQTKLNSATVAPNKDNSQKISLYMEKIKRDWEKERLELSRRCLRQFR